jgi:hypothetical protein
VATHSSGASVAFISLCFAGELGVDRFEARLVGDAGYFFAQRGGDVFGEVRHHPFDFVLPGAFVAAGATAAGGEKKGEEKQGDEDEAAHRRGIVLDRGGDESGRRKLGKCRRTRGDPQQ